MNNKYLTYITNIIFPCVFFSAVTGALTGVVIFLFKFITSRIIEFSGICYSYVRLHPEYFSFLLLSCVLLGLLSAFILKFSKNSRGGGIPSSVAILRDLISFHWLHSIIILPLSASLTYLCGVPLGNEGPSVQMGTAVGKGAVKLFPKKHAAWNRYIMTGGACAGFATATGAPVSGIFFALEEAHRRFSPMIIMVASTAVISGSTVMEFLCSSFNMPTELFDFIHFPRLPLTYVWIPVLVGIICGACAGIFTKLYNSVNVLVKEKLATVSFPVKMACVFLATGIIGFFFAECTGSGHSLIEELINGHGVWYMLLLFLAVRLLLLVFANNVGVTGGLFIPTLTFGAIIGALIGKLLVFSGLLPSHLFASVVIISIASFLSAFVRTPITAIIFSVEALGGYNNMLPVIIAVTLSYILVETMAIECFYETVIHSKVQDENKGKTSSVIDECFEVQPDAFIVGKEVRDILWPVNCTVLSVHKKGSNSAHSIGGISEGDILRIHGTTYDRKKTLFELETILGKAS